MLTVLVSGATGKQGGAVARALLKKGHAVRALTRNPASASSNSLRELGAEIFRGNFDNPISLVRAMTGIDAVFAMSTPFEFGIEAEISEGKNIAKAAKDAGIGHFVFNSSASADQNTGIPHFESKAKIEAYIRSLNLPFTIVGPVFFMENLFTPWMRPELERGKLQLPLPPFTRLQAICLADIGEFDAAVLENPERFLGKRIEIAGDELSGVHMAEVLTESLGRTIEYVEIPLEQVRLDAPEMATMFDWFNHVGTQVDINSLRREYKGIGWHRFEDWVKRQDWSFLKKAA